MTDDDKRGIALARDLFPTLRARLDRTDELTAELQFQLGQVQRLVVGSDPVDQAVAQIDASRHLVQQFTSTLLSMWLSPAIWREGRGRRVGAGALARVAAIEGVQRSRSRHPCCSKQQQDKPTISAVFQPFEDSMNETKAASENLNPAAAAGR